MTYHVLCRQCKRKRRYEGKTLGDCIKAMQADGWVIEPKATWLCGECVK